MAKKTKTNIKVDSKDNIGYEGNVTLKIQKGKKILSTKKIKNQGTLRLFQGICLALSGLPSENLKGSYLPAYLDVGSDSTATNLTDSTLKTSILKSNRVKISSLYPALIKNENNENIGYSTTFIATVPYILVGNTTINEIGMFADKEGQTLLARIIVPNGITLNQGTNLIVEWSIGIQNK